MTTKTNVLHITAHLGGGVGRVLSSLSKYSIEHHSIFKHVIVCLENPVKTQYIDETINSGGEVVIRPSLREFNSLIKESDIVQLEWWNHPETIKYLSNTNTPQMRLLTWYHNSGNTFLFPKQLILKSHIFLFTTDASFENEKIKELKNSHKDHIGVVYSSGGFDDFPHPRDRSKDDISVGYFGSLKKSKMHPCYGNYISSINIPDFKVKIIGDLSSKENLEVKNIIIGQSILNGKSNLTEFTGYVQNPIQELDNLNVLAYILNPNHYGTTENSLLQAMSMGIVPVVLDNPAEQCIVSDYKTGICVRSVFEFAEVINWLYENPKERQKMGENASKHVRETFSIENTYRQLNDYYNKIMQMKKRTINFKKILEEMFKIK